ncbi:MAG: histidine phosphatase family protein [Coriobacteriia bacterium]
MSVVHEILLARHPETVANAERRLCGATASPLTPRGERQAAALAAVIADWSPDVLYTSPSDRTRAVAVLADPLGERTVVLDDAREIEFGQAEGLTYGELDEHGIALDFTGGGPVAPGGEEGSDFDARVGRTAAVLLGGAPRTALVTHGGVLRLLLSHLIAIPPEFGWRIDLPNAAIAIVRVTDGYGMLSELRRPAE